MKTFKAFIIALALLISVGQVFAVTNTSSGAGAINWNTAGNWSQGHVPLAGEDVVIAAADTITMDVAVIPASETLFASISGDGQLVVGSASGANKIYATTITGGAKGSAGTILFSGTTCDDLTINGNVAGGTGVCVYKTSSKTLTINGTVTGGSVTNMYGLRINAAGTVAINGNITGGSQSSTMGIFINSGCTLHTTGVISGGSGGQSHGVWYYAGTLTMAHTGNVQGGSGAGAMGIAGDYHVANITLNSCNFINGTGGVAYGAYPPTWIPAATTTQTWGAVTWAKVVSADDLRDTVQNGGVTGNRTDCPAASAISTQSYGSGGTGITGTYVEATEAQVESGVNFGPASAYLGTLAAGGTTVNGIPCQ
jgi:hypothetical protein